MFREWLKFLGWVLRTIVADYLTWYSVICKSRFAVGGDRVTFGGWHFGYFRKSQVLIYSNEVFWFIPGEQVCWLPFPKAFLVIGRESLAPLHLLLVLLAYTVHLVIFSWISEPILSQYNTSHACCLGFSMTMWPWWILSNISFRIEVGITNLPPLRMTLFSSVSSSLTSQKMQVLFQRQDFVSGHPCLIISLKRSLPELEQ